MHSRHKKKDQEEGVISAFAGDKCTCQVVLGKQRFRALIDTGASVSIVSERSLTSKFHAQKILPASISLKTVSGQHLQVLGKIFLKLKVGNSLVSHWFHVVKGISNSFILGFDFISGNNVQLNFTPRENFMRIGHSRVRLTSAELVRSFVRLQHDVVLPAQTCNLVKGICKKALLSNDEEQNIGTVSQIATGFIAKEPGLMVANSLVRINNHKAIPLLIVNQTGKSIRLRKGNVIGLFNGVSDETIATIDSIAVGEREGGELSIPGTEQGPLNQLLHEHSDLFAESDMELGRTNVIKMGIDTGNESPIAVKPYRVPFNKRKVIDEQVDKMLEAGIIQPCQSPWQSPVVLISKKDGTKRFCVDYRKLNDKTTKNSWPLPHIDDILAVLGKSKFFSSLDLKSGYWQVELDSEADKMKTAFACHRGLFCFNVMPFGLCNAPSVFSELMNRVVGDLPFVLAYLDDVIIFSESKSEHIEHIRIVLDRLKDANLKLKKAKCSFFKEQINYLGHIVSKDGILPDKEKVSVIQNLKTPTCVRDVRSFVGVTNFYRKFIPNYSKIASPLLDLTGKHASFQWSDGCQKSFDELKGALTSPPVLAFPDMSKPFILYCDASDTTFGAVLTQKFNENERPIQYMSQRLSTTQRKWPILQKEAFAIYCAIEKFRHYLQGSKFTIMTDHRPLEFLFSAEIKNPMVQRWALKISSMGPDIKYLPGKQNVQADFLSRLPGNDEVDATVKVINTNAIDPKLIRQQRLMAEQARIEEDQSTPKIEIDNIGKLQAEDPDIMQLRKALENGEKSVRKNYVLKDDILFYVPTNGDKLRLVIPEVLRELVLVECHENNCHMGIDKTVDVIKENYHWRGLFRDVTEYVNSCVLCQTRDVRRNKAPLQEPDFVKSAGEKVSIDLCGPFPVSSKGNKYMVTILDLYSGWPEVFPVPDKSAENVAKVLLEEYIPRHSCPLALVSDNGTEFVNKVVENICEVMKIARIKTSIYHPQGNSQVERMHRVLNDMISKQIDKDASQWELTIPAILTAIRTSPNATSKFSPFFLHYGRDPILPLDTLLCPQRRYLGSEYHKITLERQHEAFKLVQKQLKESRKQQKKYYDKKAKELEFQIGDPVYLFNNTRTQKFDKRYLPYYRVMKKNSPVNYVVQNVINGSLSRVHVNLLKPAKLDWVTPKEEIVRRKSFYAVAPSSDSDNSSGSEVESDQELDNAAHRRSDSISSTDSESDVPLAELRTRLRSANQQFAHDTNANGNIDSSDSEQDVIQGPDQGQSNTLGAAGASNFPITEQNGSGSNVIDSAQTAEPMDVVTRTNPIKRQHSFSDDEEKPEKKHKLKALFQLISDIL